MAMNVLNRYLFEDLAVRGELVQLDKTYQDIISGKDYPPAVQKLLGELLVATTLLTATLKFEGSVTLQLQGDGPVSLAVINGDHNQKVRGIARWEGEMLDNINLHQMMGKGHLVITISPNEGERYQGVVALEGGDLSTVVENYFARSEQLRTGLWIRVGERNGQPCAAGMLLQVMPDANDSEEDFNHLEQLTYTVKDEELFNLEANELLYRLYHQETVKLFEPQPVEFQCGCSRERSSSAILTVAKEEIYDILKTEGSVILHCDYCGTSYSFDENDVTALFAKMAPESKTLH